MHQPPSSCVDAEGQQLHFSTKDEQLDLLAKVLAAGEEEASVEADTATDDVSRTAKAISAQRTKGNMAKMSGADGLTYMEYRTNAPAKRIGPVKHSKHWRNAARQAPKLET